MIRRAYPAYKPSGVEWMGDVPENWKIMQLRHLAKSLDGQRIPLNSEQRGEMQGNYPYWGANGVVDRVNDYLFDEPLVLLGEDGAPFFDRFKDVAFFVDGKIWVNNHAHVLRPRIDISPKFLTHALNITEYRAFIDGTTRDKLTQEDMKSIPITLPSTLDEQHAIATFLDRETARIDSLIEKKQRQIELLQEKRSALISHAVTKGLDPNVKMKDSGIEWLGEIPAHWNASALKRFVDPRRPITYGIVQCGEEVPDGVPYIRPVDMTDEGGADIGNLRRTAPEIAAAYSRSMVKSGDLVGSIGPSFGKVMMVSEELTGANLTQGTARIAPAKDVLNRFLFWCLRSSVIHQAWEAMVTGATFRALNLEPLSKTIVSMPLFDEQLAIVAFLDRETARIDSLIAKVQGSIEKLREYRTALISAAVTGKIDVRNEASA